MSGRARRAALLYVFLGLMQRSLALLLLPLVSRALTPSEYGVVATVVVTSSIFNVLLAGPLEIGLFRSILSRRNEFNGVERTARRFLCYILPLCMAAMCSIFWLIYAGPAEIAQLWVMELMAASLLAGVSSYGLTVSRAQDHLAKFAVVSLTSMTSLVFLKVVLVFVLEMGPTGWILSDLISAAMAWLVVQFAVVPGRRRDELGSSAWRYTMRAAVALVPHRLSFWALASFSRPLVALGFAASDAGLYAMAFSLATVATLVLSELNNAMLVSYAQDAEEGQVDASIGAVRLQATALVVVPVLGAIATWCFAPLLLGPSFQPSLPLMAGMLAGQCLYGLYVIPMNFVIHRSGRPGLSSVASAFGAGITTATIVVAIKLDSLEVAAVASSLGFAGMASAAWLLAVQNGSFPAEVGALNVIFDAAKYGLVLVPLATILLLTPPASREGWVISTLSLATCITLLLRKGDVMAGWRRQQQA